MEENKLVKCPSCGAEIEEGKKFCSNCGAIADGSAPEPPRPAGPARPFDEPPADMREHGGEMVPPPEKPEEKSPEESAVPGVKESKKERRQREKAEEKAHKEAEKQRIKDEKKAAKENARLQRRENFRKKNIWAIILMVVFFAGLCWLGYEYIVARGDIKELQAEKTELTETVESLEKTKGENEETIAQNQTDLEAQLEKQTELESEKAELSENLEELNEKLEEKEADLEEMTAAYNTLFEACGQENLGYASENLYADKAIVIIEEGATAELTVYSSKIKSIDFSGTELEVEQGTTEENSTVVTFSSKTAGVYLVSITGRTELINIIVIQK